MRSWGAAEGQSPHREALAIRATAPACSNTRVDEVDAAGRCGTLVGALLERQVIAMVRLAVVVALFLFLHQDVARTQLPSCPGSSGVRSCTGLCRRSCQHRTCATHHRQHTPRAAHSQQAN